jgi:CheY-like chemotaxis protein
MMKRYNVIYVDDEDILLELGQSFLETDPEIRVSTCISAIEALEKIKSNGYDLILSDYQMPEMDGIEFLKAVRSFSKEIPFIIFTGKGREEIVIEALNNGANFYLQKGGDPKPLFVELKHKIKQAIGRRRLEMKIGIAHDLLLELTDSRNGLEHDLKFIIDSMVNLLSVDASHMLLLKDGFLCCSVSSGIVTEELRNISMPQDKGLGGLVISTCKGHIINDYQHSDAILRPDDDPATKEGISSAMAVPIQFRDQLLGVLYALNRRQIPFKEEDLETLSMFGNLAAIEIIFNKEINQ